MRVVFKIEMNPTGENRPIRSWLLTILLLLVIVGLLAAISIPNFVGGGPGKMFGIKGVLMNIDRLKYEWAIEHGYTNNMEPTRPITTQEIATYFARNGDDPFVRMRLVIDKDGNLLYIQGVVYVINPLGISPEARFTKAFKLDDRGGFFSPKIPKGTIMRFSNDDEELVEYVLPGQESIPCKSLTELLAR